MILHGDIIKGRWADELEDIDALENLDILDDLVYSNDLAWSNIASSCFCETSTMVPCL